MKTKAKPILFSAEMVRAILAGAKTQTRRVVRPQPDGVMDGDPYWNVGGLRLREGAANPLQCPFGKPGNGLYVKETFRVWRKHGSLYTGRLSNMDEGWKRELKEGVEFRSNSYPNVEKGKWRPSIFMPPWLSRLSLKIQSVRVERLQDISEEDARSEGVCWWPALDAVALYKELWNTINGPGAWEANPWVWVVGFEVEKGNRAEGEGA